MDASLAEASAVRVSESSLASIAGLLPALVAVYPNRIWRITRTAVTVAHEGGHALVALLSGRGLIGIHLRPDTSGLTMSRGSPRGPGRVLTTLAGYPAPSLLGLAAAAPVVAGHTRLVLITVSIFLLVTLWYTRNLYGRFAMLLAIVLTALVAWSDDHNIQLLFCAGLTWFLLLGGLRAVHELRRGLRRTPMSDAHQLAALTGLPPLGWVAFFMALAVGALTLGAWLLLGSPSLN